MPLDTDYKEFRCYELLDNGDRKEITVEIDRISEYFHVENVLMIVRYDLRRLFIWKGPKAPVRKRFISSREGSKLQEETAKGGMHLKIVSVDAGDEPGEFLSAFHIETFVVKDEDRMEDMVYIRNEERKRMEEAALAKPTASTQVKAQEYKSPGITEKVTPSIVTPPKSSYTSTTLARTISSISEQDEKNILDSIIKENIPTGYKRLNIIIGTKLFSPQRTISKVFGKDIEKEDWAPVKEIPEGKIDIDLGFIRVYTKNNQINGFEVLQPLSSNPTEGQKSSSEKRKLPSIPKED